MTPMISLRLMKYRLRNYAGERKVPLEDYLRDKETDLRFNQAMAVVGLNLSSAPFIIVEVQSAGW